MKGDLYIVTDNEDYKKEVLQCRSCNSIFKASERKLIYIERCGLMIEEKVCPACGSHTYGLVEYPVDEFDLIYKKGVHRNTDKKLRGVFDQIVDEILEEDKSKLIKELVTNQIDMKHVATA
jgi:hypothetical protein